MKMKGAYLICFLLCLFSFSVSQQGDDQIKTVTDKGYVSGIIVGAEFEFSYSANVGYGPKLIEVSHDAGLDPRQQVTVTARPKGLASPLLQAHSVASVDRQLYLLSLPEYPTYNTTVDGRWIVEIRYVPPVKRVELLLGQSPNATEAFVSPKFNDDPVIWYYIVGGIALIVILNFIAAIIVFYATKQHKKQNNAAIGEKSKKVLKNCLLVPIGVVVALIGLAGAVAVLFVTRYTDVQTCCHYFERSYMNGLPSSSQCASGRRCFFDIQSQISRNVYYLYFIIPVPIVGMILFEAGFWVVTIQMFKVIRLLKPQHKVGKITRVTVAMDD